MTDHQHTELIETIGKQLAGINLNLLNDTQLQQLWAALVPFQSKKP